MRGRFDHIDHVAYLRHLLDTAEEFARAVPRTPSSDPLVQEMIRHNDEEIVELRARLAQLGAAGDDTP